MSGPCLCGDPGCGRCFVQPASCPLCGLYRPAECENCGDEETGNPCGGCPCDCLCDQSDIDAWNQAATEDDDDARYDLMTGKMTDED